MTLLEVNPIAEQRLVNWLLQNVPAWLGLQALCPAT